MFREKFEKQSIPKAKSPTEEELEIARKAYEKADPTTYSPLVLTGDLKKHHETIKGRGVLAGIHESGKYIELKPVKHPKEQQAIARLVKGIVPVADIVSHESNSRTLFSKVMPLEAIEKITDEAEQRAYVDFMYLVFGNADRREHGELQQNYVHTDDKAILYDFGGFDLTTTPLTTAPQNKWNRSTESLARLIQDLTDFSARIDGEQGQRFLQAVLKNSGIRPGDLYQAAYRETTLEDLQELLVARTNRALLIASNERKALEEVGTE